jgi:DNA-binding GntR family transcriptional regulator
MIDVDLNHPGEFDATVLRPIDGLSGSLGAKVYQSLLEAILFLKIKPGSIIRKGDICEQLGVSRSPVTEAIARLSSQGLVDVVPQSGSRVSFLSLPEIREGSFIREALEVAAVERVAQVRSGDQLARLTRSLRLQSLLVEDGDLAGFHQVDEEFHELLLEATGFPRLAQVMNSLSMQISRARYLLLPTPGRVAETVKEHAAIVDAIEKKDPAQATQAMRFHLGQLIHRIAPLETERPELFGQLRPTLQNDKMAS